MSLVALALEYRLASSTRIGKLPAANDCLMASQERVDPLRLIPSRAAAEETDAALVAALKDDEPWARREVWDRYAGPVRRYLARALGQPADDVEDLTQEVFLRVFVRRAAIRNPEALREFTLAVASRVLMWHLRSRWIRRRVRLSNDGEVPEIAVDRAPEEEARDALRRCRRILDVLSARERVAFTLRFMEEMTLEEVAVTMRISLSTAKRLLARAAKAVTARVARDAGLRAYFLNPEGDEGPGRKEEEDR
jgi:RNA polymerase sigma factor (sigma-70 family)